MLYNDNALNATMLHLLQNYIYIILYKYIKNKF